MRATSMQFSHFFSRTRVGIIDMIIDTVSERVWVGLWDERALYPNSGVSQYDCEARTAGVRCRGLNKSPTRASDIASSTRGALLCRVTEWWGF